MFEPTIEPVRVLGRGSLYEHENCRAHHRAETNFKSSRKTSFGVDGRLTGDASSGRRVIGSGSWLVVACACEQASEFGQAFDAGQQQGDADV